MAEPSPTGAPIDALFRGAARLGLLLGAMDLPWPSVTPLVAAFPAELRDELDLGVALGAGPEAPGLWLRTTVQGKAGTFRLARFLEERGVPEARLRRLLVTAAAFSHPRLLFFAGVGPSGLARFAWAVRRPLALDRALGWLADDQVDVDARARVLLAAQALERPSTHAVGEELDPGDGHRHLLALALSPQARGWAQAEAACRAAGLPAEGWRAAEARMAEWIGRDGRLLVELEDGRLTALRLEVEGVVGTSLDTVATAPGASARLDLLLELAGRDRLDLASLRLPLLGAPSAVAWSEVGPREEGDAPQPFSGVVAEG